MATFCYLRDSETATPRGPIEFMDLFIAHKNHELAPSAEISLDQVTWLPAERIIGCNNFSASESWGSA
jgi:hypothetical protein